MNWSVCYKRAIDRHGHLLFPERHSIEFLDQKRKEMGPYMYANQYLNITIPDEERRFKKEWLKTIQGVPENRFTFAFFDPSLGKHQKNSDYTGLAIVSVDYEGKWYARHLERYKWTPTELVEKIFELHKLYQFQIIGIETVAYQEALLFFLQQEMKRRQAILPIKGITRSNTKKETRILGLVPRFEQGFIEIPENATNFIEEYSGFPRGSHDDIIDALASIEEIVFYPEHKEKEIERPHSASDPNYERWFIEQLRLGKARPGKTGEGDDNGEFNEYL